MPHQIKMQYLQIYNIVDTSIQHPISGQSSSVVKGCMYICLIWQILPLVIEEYWSSANSIRNFPRWNKVVWMKSEMQILRFYLVGQNCNLARGVSLSGPSLVLLKTLNNYSLHIIFPCGNWLWMWTWKHGNLKKKRVDSCKFLQLIMCMWRS